MYAIVYDGNTVTDLEPRCGCEDDLKQYYHPDFFQYCHLVPDGVKVDVGFLYDAATDTFTPPEGYQAKLTDEDRDLALRMAQAQTQALADRNEFLEDCIAEMAAVIYV